MVFGTVAIKFHTATKNFWGKLNLVPWEKWCVGRNVNKISQGNGWGRGGGMEILRGDRFVSVFVPVAIDMFFCIFWVNL